MLGCKTTGSFSTNDFKLLKLKKKPFLSKASTNLHFFFEKKNKELEKMLYILASIKT